MTDGYEKVHAILDWYDGPRGGVADFWGEPHAFQSTYGEGHRFRLWRPNPVQLSLALEEWELYKRWDLAHQAGQDIGPDASDLDLRVLPEDAERVHEIQARLGQWLSEPPPTAVFAHGDFRLAEPWLPPKTWPLLEVRWGLE